MTIEAQLTELIELTKETNRLLSPLAEPEKPAKPQVSAKPSSPKPKKPATPPPAEETVEETEESTDDFLDDDTPEPVKLDRDTVRAALVEYQGVSSAEKARALMTKVGGTAKLGDVPEAKYKAVYDAAKAATASLKK